MHNFEIDISRVGIRVHVCAVAQHRMERQKGERERDRGFALLDPHGYTGIGVRDEPRLLNEPGVSDSFSRSLQHVRRSIAQAHRAPFLPEILELFRLKFYKVFSHQNCRTVQSKSKTF